jgi:transposase-like protein
VCEPLITIDRVRDGRPLALTKAREVAILTAVQEGATLSAAAQVAGIDAATLRRWRRRGEAPVSKRTKDRTPDERRLVRFCAAIERASAEVVLRLCICSLEHEIA